jgi:UDP-arabinose 4-epimerase
MADKTVLVTGGAGYIGSHVCKALKAAGFVPVVYDNLCSGNRGAVQWGPFVEGDVRDAEALASVIAEHAPVAIMHFAALIQVAESVADPAVYYNNNVYGSYILLEAARAAGVEHMVFSSTAAVYGLPDVGSIAEDAALTPINPYGQTKLAMENMIRDYSGAYGLKHAILRYFNAAGADAQCEAGTAYKKDTHLIPLLMQVAAGQMPQIKMFGSDYGTADGTAVRDYIHVSDLADAHVKALEHILGGGESVTLNLGTNQGYSVREVVERARVVTGEAVPSVEEGRRAGDPAVLVADARKARAVLGWEPVHSALDEILRTAWAWKRKQLGMSDKSEVA